MRTRRATINTVSFFAFQDIITSVVGIFVLIVLIMILELAQTKIGTASAQVVPVADLVQELEVLQSELESLEKLQRSLQANALRAASRNKLTIEDELGSLSQQQAEIDAELERARRRTESLKKQIAVSKQVEKQLQDQSVEASQQQERAKTAADQSQETAKFSAILETEKPLIFRDTTEQGLHLVLVVLKDQTIYLTDARQTKSEQFAGANRIAAFRKWVENADLSTRHFLLIVKPSSERDFDDVRDCLAKANATYGFDVAGESQQFRLRSQLGGF